MFQAYSPNVDPTSPCFGFFCEIRLVDVLDHTTCQVNFTGNSGADGLTVNATPTGIIIQPMFVLNPSEPFYVNVSCST